MLNSLVLKAFITSNAIAQINPNAPKPAHKFKPSAVPVASGPKQFTYNSSIMVVVDADGVLTVANNRQTDFSNWKRYDYNDKTILSPDVVLRLSVYAYAPFFPSTINLSNNDESNRYYYRVMCCKKCDTESVQKWNKLFSTLRTNECSPYCDLKQGKRIVSNEDYRTDNFILILSESDENLDEIYYKIHFVLN